MGLKPRPTSVDMQVVLQLPEGFFPSFDDMVAFEDLLIRSMPRTAQVTGHDIGSGTINFFVITPYPKAALRAFRTYMGTNHVERKIRIAFRPYGVDAPVEWTELWPKRPKRGQSPFALWYE
jgi:hypothetical protein